jgi:hypothetical protein
MTVKGTVKYYITKTKTGKLSGRISMKDAFTSELPFENSAELLAEFDEEKRVLTLKEM